MNKLNKKISDQEYEKIMSGENIYGDDFDSQDINDWFEDEKNASITCYENANPSQYDHLNYFLSNIIKWKIVYNPKSIFQKIQPVGVYIHLIKK